MEHLADSKLMSIQRISGATREEKFKEIGRLVRHAVEGTKRGQSFETCCEDVPLSLVPLIRVLVGSKLRLHSFIIESLKSRDNYVIEQALRARWFYDGSDKFVTNYENFAEQLFPYISACTRRKIVKRLAICLSDTCLAEEFFHGFVSNHGIKEAAPLLVACGADFIYDSIVKHKIILDNRLITALFHKYPNTVIRYLKFINPSNSWSQYMDTVDGHELYQSFMPLLINDYPEIFMDFQNMLHLSNTLGNKRTMLLLNKGRQLFIQRPRGVISILPFKLVYRNLSAEEFETMFGNLFPSRMDIFDLKDIMSYLEYYPKDKQVDLLLRKFKEAYGYDMFDEITLVTSSLLLLLPEEERHKQVRRIIDGHMKVEMLDSETSYWCYLPTREAIPAIKIQIGQEWKAKKKKRLFYHLAYVCKLNNDLDALLDVLRFIDEEYDHELAEALCYTLEYIVTEFDTDKFDLRYWQPLFNIIRSMRLKKEQARDYWILVKILKRNFRYYYEQKLPYDEIVDLIVKLFLEGRVGVSWKLLEDEAKYERIYMNACLKNSYWLDVDYKKNIVEGIYSFNERHFQNDQEHNEVEKLTIKDYPHLMEAIEKVAKSQRDDKCFWINYTKEKLRKHEPELFKEWFPNDNGNSNLDFDFSVNSTSETETTNNTTDKRLYVTEAIIALKDNHRVIAKNWGGYYDCCKNDLNRKKRRRVKTFLKALCWYQDLPIQFVERAIKERNLEMLGYLLDGATFCRVVEVLLPRKFETQEERNATYVDALHMTAVVKNTCCSELPVGLVERYLKSYEMYEFKNYINCGLTLWSYVAYRSSSREMMILARSLAPERLLLKKHAIRIVSCWASRKDAGEFFLLLWDNERHPLIRTMLARKIGHLFTSRPSMESWNLVSMCLGKLSYRECNIFEALLSTGRVPVNFASVYAVEVLRKIKKFMEDGIGTNQLTESLITVFRYIDADCSDCLPEDFYREILRMFIELARKVPVASNDLSPLAEQFILKVYLKPSSEHFEMRFQFFSEMISDEVARYNKLSFDERKKTYCLLNSVVHTLTHVVIDYRRNAKLTERLFEVVQKVCLPYHNISTYVNLYLCVEFAKADYSFRDLGLRVSAGIGDLCKKFDLIYPMVMADLIRELYQSYLYEYFQNVRNRVSFLEGLIETKDTHSILIAAGLLNKEFICKYDRGYYKIINILASVEDPIIQSLL